MSHGCSRDNPKSTSPDGPYCGYWVLVDTPFSQITPVTVFRAGLTGAGWRWMGDLYWNGRDAGWHFCRDHWYLSYHQSLFEELRGMPSWIS